MIATLFAALATLIWLSLWLAHGQFWRIENEPLPSAPSEWPRVTVIIPARNEEEGIGGTLRTLFTQDYSSPLRIVVVDDHSTDATARKALETAQELGREQDLTVIPAEPLPARWTGKVWAMHQGVTRELLAEDPATYLLFSDADIHHDPCAVRELVTRSEADQLDLASFMVRLRCDNGAESLMIPAFVFFFRMLYPFRWSNDPANPMAAAAGGTMLLRRSALPRLDNLTCIHDALIDDCALARSVKKGGNRIWLGLSDTSSSTRSYHSLGEIVHMVARTAYTQLDYSPLQLLGCLVGLTLTFLLPVALTFSRTGLPALVGAALWLLMARLYLPMIRFYHRSPLLALTLPLTATLYLYATLLSAIRHHSGRGGQWKGRTN